MKKTDYTLNGKPIKITDSWEKATFGQYLRIMTYNGNIIDLISILTGITHEIISKAKIEGLAKIMYASRFINTEPELPAKLTNIGPYKLPLNKAGIFDVQFESLAQFEDMRQLIEGLPKSDEISSKQKIFNLTECYGKLVAIYLQKLRDKEYSYAKSEQMLPEVYDMPALEVIAGGSFFLTSVLLSLNGITPNYRNTPQQHKKNTGRSFKRRSGSRR